MNKFRHHLFSLLTFLVLSFVVIFNTAHVYSAERPLQWVNDALKNLFGDKPQGENPPDITPIPNDIHSPGNLPGTTLAPGSFPYVPGPLPFTPPSGYKYFSQCSPQFGGLLLPNCPSKTLCNAGCGPTTVAMIIASLKNASYNPAAALNDYQRNNFPVTCGGTYSGHAKSVLQLNGLVTTGYRYYNTETVNSRIAGDFKSLLNSGYTIFALANYCPEGCGHFYWIIEIDNNNNVWAYDPYYGRSEAPPINENRYSPFPKYREIFGVRR